MEDREREYMQRRHDEIQMARAAASRDGSSRQDQSLRLLTPNPSREFREARFRLEDLEEITTSYSMPQYTKSFQERQEATPAEPGARYQHAATMPMIPAEHDADMTSTMSVQTTGDGFLTPRERNTVAEKSTGPPSFGMTFTDDDNRFLTLDDDTPHARSNTTRRTSRDVGPSVPMMVARMSSAPVTRFSRQTTVSAGSSGSNSATSWSDALSGSKKTARITEKVTELPEISEAPCTETGEDRAATREAMG
jgi:hypothetical protein